MDFCFIQLHFVTQIQLCFHLLSITFLTITFVYVSSQSNNRIICYSFLDLFYFMFMNVYLHTYVYTVFVHGLQMAVRQRVTVRNQTEVLCRSNMLCSADPSPQLQACYPYMVAFQIIWERRRRMQLYYLVITYLSSSNALSFPPSLTWITFWVLKNFPWFSCQSTKSASLKLCLIWGYLYFIFFFLKFVWVHVCVWEWGMVPSLCVEVRRHPQSSSFPPMCLRQGLLFNAACARLPGPWVSRDCRDSTSHSL